MPHSMDYNIFVSLVGEDLIQRFKLFDDLLTREGITEDFLTLYKIWNYFHKPDSLPDKNRDDVVITKVPESCDNILLNSGSDVELNLPTHPPQNESKVKVVQNIVLNEPNTDSNYCLPSTSKSIGVYLEEPEKPTRKNKRNTERVSFAITSRCYQESFERKRALKLEAENKKMERKRKKEEKAAAKSLKKTAQVSDNNNLCFVCKVRTIKSNFLTCDSCRRRIHHRCVPKKHEAYAPEEGEDDLFICHLCYTEESDEDANSEMESGEDSEIDDGREIDRKIVEQSKNSIENIKIINNVNIPENHKFLLEIVDECKDQMDIEEKVDGEKGKSNQNPEIIKSSMRKIPEKNTDDEMEIDELFNMYQTEMKNIYKFK